MQIHNFKELKIWKLGRSLVKDIYIATNSCPQREQFGLTSQIRRAAISIPSNIAEGSGRGTKDFSRFLTMALSSAFEVETQLFLAHDLEFLPETTTNKLLEQVQEIQKMIYGLQRKLNTES